MRNKFIGKLFNKSKDKLKRIVRRRIIIYIVTFVLPIVLFAVTLFEITYYAYNNFFSSIISAHNILDMWEEADDSGKGLNFGEQAKQSDYPQYGIYPVDYELRIKQEMMEISDNIGKIYGLPGKLIMAVAAVETTTWKNPKLDTANGSLYKNLCIDNTSYKGTSYFIDSINTGKYRDKNGILIIDPKKVGQVRNDLAGSVGPFQFYCKYINTTFGSMYSNENGVVSEKKVPIMSWFDEELEFMRPNPLYYPDAALNAAELIVSHMNTDTHKKLMLDIQELDLPDSVRQEILFIYAADQYHGDTAAYSNGKPVKGEESIVVHDNIAELYSDMFIYYKNKGYISESLGDFSKLEYNQSALRAATGGVPFYVKNSNNQDCIDFDGTYAHADKFKVVKSDALGKYVEFGGNKYYKPIITELSNNTPFNKNYKQIISSMSSTKGGGTNNKFGWLYGFEGINEAYYYWDLWTQQIAEAEKEVITDNEGIEIPINGAIQPDAYPLGDINKWLKGDTDANEILMGRLAYLAEMHYKESGLVAKILESNIINITSGYRSAEEQLRINRELYKNNKSIGYYMKSNGAVYNDKGQCMAAAPGRSRHQTGLAVDISNSWLKKMNNTELQKYGLKKPMSYENWHIEPIETSKR